MTDLSPLAGIVKPLTFGKWGEAFGGGAKYSVYDTRPGEWNCVCYPHEGEQYRIAEGVTRAEAEAAAQADYTARILAAIDTDRITALVEALETIALLSECRASRQEARTALAAMKGQPHD